MIPVATFQARVDEITAQRHNEKRRADALEAQLMEMRTRVQALSAPQAPPPQPGYVPPQGYVQPQQGYVPLPSPPAPTQALTQEYINAEAQRRATEIADVNAFNDRCNVAAAAGRQAYGDAEFNQSVSVLNTMGVLQRPLIEAALETGIGPRLIYELGRNPAKAGELASLPPMRQAVALAKFANEINSAPPPSKAPPPNPGVLAGAAPPAGLDVNQGEGNIADWMAARQKQLKEKNKRR
jgi:hypothetical protein